MYRTSISPAVFLMVSLHSFSDDGFSTGNADRM